MQAVTITQITLDELEHLFDKSVEKIYIKNQTTFQPETETPIGLEEVELITGYAKPTLYGKVQRNELPHHKKGNRLYFFKTEIIEWIKTGKQKTNKELEVETDEYLSNKNKGLK